MERIRRAWNWRPEGTVRRSVKFVALRALATLLVVMVACTLVSRAADTLTVPVVQVQSPRRGAVTRSFQVTGTFEVAGGVAVMVPASMAVTDVAVDAGDSVEAGDLLFTYDASENSREISAKQLSIQGTQTELALLRAKREFDERKGETALVRADEDYDSVVEKHELILWEKGEQLRVARDALKKYDFVSRADYDDEEYTREEHEQLRANYRTAQIAYEQAEADRDRALREKEREIDDLGAEREPDSAEQLKTLELRRLELELAELLETTANGGNVYAPAAGIVTALNVKVGGRTSSEAAAIITDPGGLRFVTEIDKDQKEYVEVGDPFELTLSGERRSQTGMVVTALTAIAEKPGLFQLVGEVPEDLAVPGRSAEATFTNTSRQYDACVPLSALYPGEYGDYYVMAVREVESVLGAETIAERISVTLEEQNGVTAAVTGPLDANSRVITGSDRPLRDGDRVRLETA